MVNSTHRDNHKAGDEVIGAGHVEIPVQGVDELTLKQLQAAGKGISKGGCSKR